MRLTLLILVIVILAASGSALAAQEEREITTHGYHALSLYDGDQGRPRLWEVESVESAPQGGVMVNLIAFYPQDIVQKVLSGEITAEIASGEDSRPVLLQLFRRCHCRNGAVVTQNLRDSPSSTCLDCCGSEGWENDVYYFLVAESLSGGAELGIGRDPGQLVLIERE